MAEHSRNTALYVCILIYLLSLAAIGYVANRRKRAIAEDGDELQAHFGGSFRAPLLILTTFSTIYSGFTVTGIPEEAYKRGFISLRWIGATLVIVASMLYFYPRLRRLAQERKYEGPNDFIMDRYGSPRLRILCALCGCVPMTIYLTAQMISFTAMVQGFTFEAMPRWVSMLVFCIIILGMEKLGGMNSVVLTDAAQSVVMIGAFLVVPFVLGAEYGFLDEIAPADCSSLRYFLNSTSADRPPQACQHQGGKAIGAGCFPSGCLQDTQPEFFQYPSHADRCSILFFFVNMLAAPLQPHMIQRTYIAASDWDLRLVMGAMLVAPFLAQTPGIMIGLTKAAFEPSWPAASRDATAFAAVSDQLSRSGPGQYLLVVVMSCSTLAAIMSTADSALLGASSLLSIDVYKAQFHKAASQEAVVRVSGFISIGLAAVGFVAGMNLTVSQMGQIITFQNGMLMQLMPAFGLGLYLPISERSVTGGIAAGLVAVVMLACSGNPLDPYVPLVNVSVFVNFAVVAAIHCLAPGTGDAQAEAGGSAEPRLTPEGIRSVMAASAEPGHALLGSMLLLAVLSVPWYRSPGLPEEIVAGLPAWGLIQIVLFVLVFGLGVLAVARWRPGVAREGAAAAKGEAPGPPAPAQAGSGWRGRVARDEAAAAKGEAPSPPASAQAGTCQGDVKTTGCPSPTSQDAAQEGTPSQAQPAGEGDLRHIEL